MTSAASHLIAGDLVAFPTETVYGLGADACSRAAVARIYQVKGRPADHPLIVHISSMDRMGDWASDVPEYAIKLARDFWPGPMTLVLKRSELAGDFVTGGQDTVGVRVPNHAVALALLEAFEIAGGKGVAAPSANRFGRVSPTKAAAVIEELGDYLSDDDLVLDGGECVVGIESTIIDCTGQAPRILRPGAITSEMIEQVIATTELIETRDNLEVTPNIRVSGSHEIHYAPKAKVLLNQIPTAGQGFIAMADIISDHGVVRLAAPETHEELARILYAALRSADEKELETVVVAQPMGDGIAVAIRDRLQRAARLIEGGLDEK
jgi:L-threonylcarbamoyladenylate synthase